MKADYLLTPYTRINSKWIKDLNVKFKTIKILEENTCSKILDIAHSNIFSDISPQARETKHKQLGLHQTEKFLLEAEIFLSLKSVSEYPELGR